MTTPNSTPAVFLDRDGTMIHDAHYLSRREDVRWYPWTIECIRLLGRAGFRVFVVTNQGGIGLGQFSESFVVALHQEMDDAVRAGGGEVHGWFHCPHHPDAVDPALRGPCVCRKPGRGMIDQAAALGPLDLGRSFVVGDKRADVQMAETVGARGVLVETGYGAQEVAKHRAELPRGTWVTATLAEATARILEHAAAAPQGDVA